MKGIREALRANIAAMAWVYFGDFGWRLEMGGWMGEMDTIGLAEIDIPRFLHCT